MRYFGKMNLYYVPQVHYCVAAMQTYFSSFNGECSSSILLTFHIWITYSVSLSHSLLWILIEWLMMLINHTWCWTFPNKLISSFRCILSTSTRSHQSRADRLTCESSIDAWKLIFLEFNNNRLSKICLECRSLAILRNKKLVINIWKF